MNRTETPSQAVGLRAMKRLRLPELFCPHPAGVRHSPAPARPYRALQPEGLQCPFHPVSRQGQKLGRDGACGAVPMPLQGQNHVPQGQQELCRPYGTSRFVVCRIVLPGFRPYGTWAVCDFRGATIDFRLKTLFVNRKSQIAPRKSHITRRFRSTLSRFAEWCAASGEKKGRWAAGWGVPLLEPFPSPPISPLFPPADLTIPLRTQ